MTRLIIDRGKQLQFPVVLAIQYGGSREWETYSIRILSYEWFCEVLLSNFIVELIKSQQHKVKQKKKRRTLM